MNELVGIYKQMYENWPKPIVVRRDNELSSFTFGLFKSKGAMANLDSKGEGPPSKESVGCQVCYDAYDFALWLQTRNKVENKIIASSSDETKIYPMQPIENIPKKFSFVTDSNGNILRPSMA